VLLLSSPVNDESLLCSDEGFSMEQNTCREVPVAGESCSTKILEVAAANVPLIHKNDSYHSKICSRQGST